MCGVLCGWFGLLGLLDCGVCGLLIVLETYVLHTFTLSLLICWFAVWLLGFGVIVVVCRGWLPFAFGLGVGVVIVA